VNVVMRPAGVVRKVDQLGRIVLPKSLRKRYRMNEGDPVEILVQGDHILLERYRPRCVFCGEVEHVTEYMEKHICRTCMSDMSSIRA
jgi:AbrB family transcriptional regulator, transcriptional pleiotropic regulator of transition state genes